MGQEVRVERLTAPVDVLAVLADNAAWADQVSLRADVPIRVRSAAKSVNAAGIQARDAVADMQKHYAMLLRGQKHAIEMLRGERRKERAEIDAMAEYRDLAEAALARCKGEAK